MDHRAKFVEDYLQPILYNKKVPERAIITAMLISISINDQSIFTDSSSSSTITLLNSSIGYSLERSRAEDDRVRLKILEITLDYFKSHVSWLEAGYSKLLDVTAPPFRSIEAAKTMIRKLKTSVASVSDKKSKSGVQYIFGNLPPENASKSRSGQPQQHKLDALNSSLKDALVPPNSNDTTSDNIPSSSATPSTANPTFTFSIEKKTGKNSNWKVTITIPSSSPQACFYRLMLLDNYSVKGFAVQDTKISCVNAVAGFMFNLSSEKFLDRELAKQQKKSTSDVVIDVNYLRKLASRVVSDGFKAVYFSWCGADFGAGRRNLLASELEGLGTTFKRLLQDNLKFVKLLTTRVSSSNRQEIPKRIVANLKSLDSNKQPVSKMLFKTMSTNSNSSIEIPYAGVDCSSKFTAFIDNKTLAFQLSDNRIVPVFDDQNDIQKPVNLKIYAKKQSKRDSGCEGVEITTILTPNFAITKSGTTVLPMPRSIHPLHNTDACRATLSPGVFWFDKCREKVSVHFPLTVHRNLRLSKGYKPGITLYTRTYHWKILKLNRDQFGQSHQIPPLRAPRIHPPSNQ